MNPTVIPQAAWLLMLTELTTVAMLWAGAKVRLFKNNAVLGPGTLLADLTTADFTGYADSAAITWGSPAYQPNGTAVVLGDLKSFQVGATPTVYNTIYGFAVMDGAAANLLFAKKFDAPVVLSGAHQICDVLPTFPSYATP